MLKTVDCCLSDQGGLCECPFNTIGLTIFLDEAVEIK